jgi:uncharacterized FAD-dependent dehydrogenase
MVLPLQSKSGIAAAFLPSDPLFVTTVHSACWRRRVSIFVQRSDDDAGIPMPRIGRRRTKPKPPKNTSIQTWRVFDVKVHPDQLAVREDDDTLHSSVLNALRTRLHAGTIQNDAPWQSVQLVRRSLDARSSKASSKDGTGPRYVFVLDVTVPAHAASRWKHQPGRLEWLSSSSSASPVIKTMGSIHTERECHHQQQNTPPPLLKRRVVIVGAGPAGLFCALQLARTGRVTPVLLERGAPVETRGRDIGALMHRRQLHRDSNFAFGEGGAGTWSDGKLTTRIGRNAEGVRQVLEQLVAYGAPRNILTEGAPHLGTDNLVRLLRNLRADLRRMGGIIQFGCKMTELVIENNVTRGVKFTASRDVVVERNMPGNGDGVQVDLPNGGNGILMGDAVVLATGHSARDVYEQLHQSGVSLEAKGFAVGFRVEHPQKLINQIQYGTEWGPSVVTGKRSTDTANADYFFSASSSFDTNSYDIARHHPGTLPVPSYRLATDQAFDGNRTRGVYSFCMCPGGQIVPASTDPEEVCVNGMSFSKRDSPWANSALVVTVDPDDAILEPYRAEHGVLAGIAFQRDMERRASIMGGGNLVVPVQRLTDFLDDRPSTSAPPSSYRLGVNPAACHRIYPEPLVTSLKEALTDHFNKQMPGFVCEDGLLHAVETRTSSPVRVARDPDSRHAIGIRNLYPAGEGAGFAGGIVSAAVDGIVVANALLKDLDLMDGSRGKSEIELETTKVME